MKYEIDVEKVTADIRTFLVEADSPMQAKRIAVERAKAVDWTLKSEPEFYPLEVVSI